jgi:5-methylcytosine-specific restriction endonuclease McrA
MFEYRLISPGERLCSFLFENMIDCSAWDQLENKHLHVTRRASGYRSYFQELLALNLTHRLILAAEYLRTVINASESGFLQQLQAPIHACGLHTLDSSGTLSRLVRDAVIAAHHDISPTLRRNMLTWAAREHRHCYLCGITLNFDLGQTANDNDVTLDHLWPQSYGGESTDENLLPACRSCNTKLKKSIPSWAGCAIQTLTIRREPSKEALKIDKMFRFALHDREARRYANERKMTLKQAYRKLGPWEDSPSLLNEEDDGDFFNLTMHS